MSESIKNPEFNLADFPLVSKTLDNFREGEREAGKYKHSNLNIRSKKLFEAIEQFPDLAPAIEFLLDPKNTEEDRISKVEELNLKSVGSKAGMYNTVSFESGSGKNITLSYINGGKYSLSYLISDKNN